MASPLVIKALDTYAIIFQRYLETIPIIWDDKRKQLVYISKKRDLVLWYISIILLLGIGGVGSCTYLIVREIFNKESSMPLWKIIITGLPLVLAIFCCLVNLVFKLFGNDAVQVWNCLNLVEKSLLNFKGNGPRQTQEEGLLGYGLFVAIFFFASAPFFVTPLVMLATLHPIQQIAKEVLGPEIHIRFGPLITTLESLQLFMALVEICRMIPLLLVYITVLLRIKARILGLISQGRKLVPCIHFYKIGQIVLNVYIPFEEVLAISMMSGGFFLSLGYNFVTLKMHSVVPMPLYFICPALSFTVGFIIYSILPFAIRVHEDSSKLLHKWRCDRRIFTSTGKINKYIEKTIKSLRPWTLFGGIGGFRFFQLRNSIKVAYYGVILDYTITLLLSVPSEALLEK